LAVLAAEKRADLTLRAAMKLAAASERSAAAVERSDARAELWHTQQTERHEVSWSSGWGDGYIWRVRNTGRDDAADVEMVITVNGEDVKSFAGIVRPSLYMEFPLIRLVVAHLQSRKPAPTMIEIAETADWTSGSGLKFSARQMERHVEIAPVPTSLQAWSPGTQR
jgi:hypothetical protein